MLFADDVLLFAKAHNLSIQAIKETISSFCKTSGMDINLDKSKLWLSPHIPSNRKDLITNCLQIPSITNLGTYVGYQLKTNYTSSDFNQIIQKMQQKLNSWKLHYIPSAGRLQLISDTLNQIPNYQMRVFSLPKNIHTKIDRLYMNFLWAHTFLIKRST